ncbi:hypothetical protein Pmar_PMAR020310, partial [Perkinsus marinus ATCC 50983]
ILLRLHQALVFSEIIPSAVFTGPDQLSIGAALAPLVKFFMVVLYPVAGPVAWCLDKMLGEEHRGRYNKAEFNASLNLHQCYELEGGTCLRPMRLISRQEEATNRLRRMLTRQLEEAVQQGEVKSIIVY